MTTWAWNDEADREGVGHYSAANTDYSDATNIQQAYDYVNFSEITPNPVACYPLHEDSGTTATDKAGTNDGTYNGPTLGQTGLLGTTAPSYDGTDDYIDCGGTVVNSTPLTIMIWWHPEGGFESAALSNHGGGFGNRGGVTIEADDSDTPRAAVGDGAFTDFIPSTNYDVNSWHHLALTHDGSTAILYVDGTNAASGSVGYTSASINLNIGRTSYYSSYSAGRLADARAYNNALTASQIQTHYDVVATQGDWLGTGKTL